MLISVIIPFYKEVDLIGRAILSVGNQRLPDGYSLEIVIGNDSNISKSELFHLFPPRLNARVLISNNTNAKGAGNARNAAIDASTGGLIAFLDADDYWEPDKLMQQVKEIQRGANFVAASYRYSTTDTFVRPPIFINSTIDVLTNTNIGTSTVLLKRELLGSDRFSNIKFSQDTELWARLAAKKNFVFTPVISICATYEPSARTKNKFIQLFYFIKLVSIFNIKHTERLGVISKYVYRGIKNHYISKFGL